jgi:hypothetical protein
MNPVVYVDVYRSRRPWHGRVWRWRAKNADNREIMASGQAYREQGDAIAAVVQLFGDGSNVYLRRAEQGNVALRMAGDA